MKQPTDCPHCGLTFDLAFTLTCPYCGKEPHPQDCPDPVCTLDLDNTAVCQDCPKKPKPRNSSWGGKRPGAGAPAGNINRLRHGTQSKLLQKGITRLAEDPELRAVFYILVRLASGVHLPAETRKLIQKLGQGVL